MTQTPCTQASARMTSVVRVCYPCACVRLHVCACVRLFLSLYLSLSLSSLLSVSLFCLSSLCRARALFLHLCLRSLSLSLSLWRSNTETDRQTDIQTRHTAPRRDSVEPRTDYAQLLFTAHLPARRAPPASARRALVLAAPAPTYTAAAEPDSIARNSERKGDHTSKNTHDGWHRAWSWLGSLPRTQATGCCVLSLCGKEWRETFPQRCGNNAKNPKYMALLHKVL